jgi:hypothetical protein
MNKKGFMGAAAVGKKGGVEMLRRLSVAFLSSLVPISISFGFHFFQLTLYFCFSLFLSSQLDFSDILFLRLKKNLV